MTDSEILNPKAMAPACKELWFWYQTLAPRVRTAYARQELRNIADEIEAHAVEIEYLCRT